MLKEWDNTTTVTNNHYGNDPYGSSSYDTSYSDDDKSYDQSYDRVMTNSYDSQQYYGPQQPSYDKPRYLIKVLTVTLATTKPKTKNMNVEQVHLKASL